MSFPDRIVLKGYRSFQSEVTFPIRALTLLYGANNAGKSHLARLLPILSDSCGPDAASPLDLDGEAGGGASFRDVSPRGRVRTNLELGFQWDDADFKARYELSLNDTGLEGAPEEAYIYKLRVSRADEQICLENTQKPGLNQFEITPGLGIPRNEGDGCVVQRDFAGLLPRSPSQPDLASDLLQELERRIAGFHQAVHWIPTVRPGPANPLIAKRGSPSRLPAAPSAEEAYELAARVPEIRADLNRFYHELQRELGLEEIPPGHWRLTLDPKLKVQPRDPEDEILTASQPTKIRMGEVGEGMSHVLPVLVGLALHTTKKSPRILVVEEPDSHLHGNAQQALIRHICTKVKEAPSTSRVVLETHSRLFLLGVQKAVLEGMLSPEQVQIIWVDAREGWSTVYPISVRADGSLDGWPPDALDDELNLARSLVDLQLERM